jgi:uncharacterized cupin superfamily protein
VARVAVLSRSQDLFAWTVMWDCTAGRFNWHYGFDETVHIVEGSVIVSCAGTPPRRLEVGDVAYFPFGLTAHWHVEEYVRKVAFCRRPLPAKVMPIISVMRRTKRLLRKQTAGSSALGA